MRVLFLATNASLAVHANRPLRTVEDFRGLRVRFPGSVAAATLAALGAIPVSVFPLDVPDAFRNGTIDAAAMSYQGAAAIGLAGLVKYSTDLYANTITLGLVMHQASYERLGAAERAVIDEVLGESAGRTLARALARDARLGRNSMRDSGVTIITPRMRKREAFNAAVRPVIANTIAELAARGLPAQAAYDALKAGVAMHQTAAPTV